MLMRLTWMLYLQYLLGERERAEGKEDDHSCDSVCALVVDDAAAVSPIYGGDSPPSPRKFNNPVLPSPLSPLYILNERRVSGHQFIVFEIRRRSL